MNIDKMLEEALTIHRAEKALGEAAETARRELEDHKERVRIKNRKQKILDMLNVAQKNIETLLKYANNNKDLRIFTQRLLECGAHTRNRLEYKDTGKKKAVPELGTGRKLWGEMETIECEDFVFEIGREDSGANTPKEKNIIIALTLPKSAPGKREIGKDISETKIEILMHTHDYGLCSDSYDTCRYYENEHLDQLLASLTNPSSTLRILVEKNSVGVGVH